MKKREKKIQVSNAEWSSLKEKDRLQSILMDVLPRLLLEKSLHGLFDVVSGLLDNAMGIKDVWAFEKNESNKVLKLLAVHGPHVEKYNVEIEALKDERDRFTNDIWNKFKVDVIPDCRIDSRVNQAYVKVRGYRTAIHVPMRLSGEKFGIFACATFEDQGCIDVSEIQITFLKNLAALIAVFINRINTSMTLRKSKAALLESSQRWESFARNSKDVIIHVDKTGKILYINRASASDVLQKSMFEFLPVKSEHTYIRAALNKVFTELIPASYQVTGFNKKGHKVIYHSRVSPVIINHKIVYATIVSSDITESIQTRNALEKSEFLYRSMLDNSPTNIYIKDLNGCYIDVNKNYLRSLGFKKSDVIGKTDYELFSKKTAEQFRANDKEVLATGKAREFEEILYKKNEEIIFLTVKYPLYTSEQNLYALGGISSNITSGIRNRIRARESELRYRELADNSPLAIVIHQDHKILYANHTALKLVDASDPGQLIGRNIMDFIHPASVNIAKESVKRIYERKGNSLPKDYQLITLKGVTKSVEIAGTMITYKGKPASQVVLRDITLQKQWEAVVSRYEHIVNATNDKLSFIDRNYIYRAVNKSYYKMHGAGAGQIIGHSIKDIFGEDVFEKNIRPYFDRCLNGEVINYQYWFDFEAGGKRFMDVSYYPYYEKDNKTISGVVVSSHDITERKLIEDELLLLNRVINASTLGLSRMELMETACRELAVAFDASQAVISLINSKGDALQVVTAWPESVRAFKTGRVLRVKDIPEYAEFTKNPTPRMIESIDDFEQLGLLGKLLKQEKIISVLILPLFVNKRLIGLLSLDCIKKRKFESKKIQTIERVVAQLSSAIGYVELQEQQKRMAMALEQTFETIIITDTEGIVVYANPAFEQTMGYACKEIIGYSIGKIKSGRHDEAFYRDLWTTIKNGNVWRGLFINRKKSGELIYEEATITPIRDELGKITNYVSVQHDVTREQELERQLRQAQKMEAIGQLVGGVAHDFNNVLTSIMSYAGFALEFGDVPLTSRTADDLRGILNSAERAAKLTRQLLTFARKQVTTPKIINVNDYILEIESMLKRLINENITLVTHLDPSLKTIRIDPAQFEQVLINMVVNARDAMPNGGTLHIDTENYIQRPGQSALCQPGEYVLIRIKDTGHGVPDDIQERIFEPFFTTKPASQGTGLGLSTCFGIIHKHDGVIDLKSNKDTGTEFLIYFPVNSSGPVADISQMPHSLTPGGNETILLVEDEIALREVTARGLRQKGYRVIEATNGKEAIDLMLDKENLKFDLLLSDVIMPEIGGKKLLQIVTNHYPDVKIILMSGYAELELDPDNEKFLFLQKPFQQDVLYEKIRMLLDKKAP